MGFWKGKSVFVTGADGFIGSWVAKQLVDEDAKVTILVRDLKPEMGFDFHKLREEVNIVHGDLVDLQLQQRAMNEYNVDTVFHIAAQAIVGIANKSPISTFESNIKGTWNIMEAARVENVKRVVVASSDKAYGVQKQLPYTEESPLHGLYPYDASKAAADIIARSYAATYGMNVAVTRNANTYGGGDMNFSRIVPDAIKHIFSQKSFDIRSDGKAERDYMYVKDAAAGYLLLAENLHRKEVQGQAFNFGTERPLSVVELFNKIAIACGKPKAEFKVLGTARNEIDRQYLASAKAKKVIGWQPKYSLEEGLKETVLWYRNYFEDKGL